MTHEGVPEEHAEAAKSLGERGFEVESVLGRGGVGVVFGVKRDGESLAVQSEPCPVSWSVDGAGSWCASLRPSFDVPAKQVPGAGALVLGVWFFEGDWMAGG